ncbi:MAG: hypothetical protein ACREAF_01205 [Nitrosopumilaceae archaeon]
MPNVDISHIGINFPSHAYTIEELVDNLFSNKLEDEVKKFSKKELGIEKVYKAYDLSKIKIEDPSYFVPDIQLNDMYVEIAEKALRFSKRKPKDIGLLITINDNQQYLDPSPTVEIATRLGLNKDVRTQNFQGMACSSFSEALRNAAGHFALGYKSDVLVLIGTYYTSWFLDRIKQIDRISLKNKKDFNNFIYFLIFSDVTAATILSQSKKSDKFLARIDIETISSRKDTTLDGYKKATIKLSPDNCHRIAFDMDVNSKILKESAAQLSLENISYIKQRFPKDFKNVKSWGFHSAGSVFVDYVRERCGIEKERTKLTYDLMRETGNTGAVSSLQLIKESVERKIVSNGEVGGIVDYGWEGADAFLYKVHR